MAQRRLHFACSYEWFDRAAEAVACRKSTYAELCTHHLRLSQATPNDTALLCMPLDYIAGKMVVVRSIERKLRLLSVKPSGNPLSDASLAQLSNPDEPITFAAMVPLQVFNTLQTVRNANDCHVAFAI